ncbi:MAG: CobD/CbiB family protein [Candidatus Nitricoxidivorans perseverans]|uniref:Cobalamin biosynthesis protein CobD n=1 Tax=Candidatus Nitricoxidivorans perseverans TaxID=2975601 RepID=A0AA49FMP7_9PROT|nr:MAG: CobD/CbiB family protein [Candidatus Nitricoxidivorans perseverans]
MTLLTIILALLIEQARPLAVGRTCAVLRAWARFLEGQFNAGERRQGLVAWLVGAALPSALLLALQGALAWWGQWLAAAFLGVVTLYLTMGFRQFSHFFTDIHLALRAGELERARQLLAEWRGQTGERLTSGEVARLAIEEALLSSHRHVFAPLFWFVLLGPAGALLYRLSAFFFREWGNGSQFGEFGEFARHAFGAIDWLPVRVTATAFAIVGDFEDAVFCWRSQAGRWPDPADGILLASGGGALGVRLGLPVHDADGDSDDGGKRPELGTGDPADTDFMQSTIGLVWRTLVMALLLLALLSVAGWAGT